MRVRSHRLFSSILVAWLALLQVTRLAAQDAPAVRDHTVQEAHARHRAGVEAFADKRYPEAIEAFLSSDALHPTPASAYNVAKACEAQGDVSRALSFYREYLRRSPNAQDRETVNAKADQLAKKLGERGVQQVTFSAQPAAATVLLDSEPIGTTPITLDLRPGRHRVEFRKSGHAPASVEFELPVDRALDVLATLEPAVDAPSALATTLDKPAAGELNPRPIEVVSAAPRAPSRQVAPSRRPASVTRTIGFAALGAGVAALGGAVTLEIMRANAEQEARSASDQVAFSEALERMKTRQTMARVFAGAGGALAALGGVMLVIASGSGERSPKSGGVAFACQPVKCEATYARRF